MYHEEKVINGKLCWRADPNGDWTEYTYEQLLEKYQRLELCEFNFRTECERLRAKVEQQADNTPMQAEKLAQIAAYLKVMEECEQTHGGLISRKAVCQDLRQLLHG